MSDPHEQYAAGEPSGDTEEVDAVVVTPGEDAPATARFSRAAAPAIQAAAPVIQAAAPVIQAAAVVATGFVAGAATAGLVRRRRDRRALVRSLGRRSLGRAGRSGGRGEVVQIVGSRSLLVDVHLLGDARRR